MFEFSVFVPRDVEQDQEANRGSSVLRREGSGVVEHGRTVLHSMR
jgi:hypothetical protein